MQTEPATETPVTGFGAQTIVIERPVAVPTAEMGEHKWWHLTGEECKGVKASFDALVARGVPPSQAHCMVIRAVLRVKHRGVRQGPYGSAGLGQYVTSTAEFNLLNKVQNHAIALQAEISGIGAMAWDSAIVENSAAFERAGWKPYEDYFHDKMMTFWLANIKSILVTPGQRPTVAQVNEVERSAGGTEKLIALVKSFIPAAAKVEGEQFRAQTEKGLEKSRLESPEVAASAAFKEELIAGAKGLLGVGTAITISAIALLLLGYMALKK